MLSFELGRWFIVFPSSIIIVRCTVKLTKLRHSNKFDHEMFSHIFSYEEITDKLSYLLLPLLVLYCTLSFFDSKLNIRMCIKNTSILMFNTGAR